ncbi:MAG: thioredoxin domain-containing protein, partial [bacterium]|nr:thioredoxin domain-containing protein [bacterium]
LIERYILDSRSGAIAAGNQGNYWEMSSLLFEKQPKNMKAMLKLAKKLNFNEEQFVNDFGSAETTARMQKEVRYGDNYGIDATPTMFINGKRYVGIRGYNKLKDILEQNGAVKK